jgi:hypothetical protein
MLVVETSLTTAKKKKQLRENGCKGTEIHKREETADSSLHNE